MDPTSNYRNSATAEDFDLQAKCMFRYALALSVALISDERYFDPLLSCRDTERVTVSQRHRLMISPRSSAISKPKEVFQDPREQTGVRLDSHNLATRLPAWLLLME